MSFPRHVRAQASIWCRSSRTRPFLCSACWSALTLTLLLRCGLSGCDSTTAAGGSGGTGGGGGGGGADGGGSAGGGGGGGPIPTGVCATESAGTTSDGEAVTICTAFHQAAPFVRLPDDTESVFYGSVDMNSAHFMTRDGVAHTLTSADGSQEFTCAQTIPPTCADLPGFEALHAVNGPSHRWLYTVYRIEGALSGDDLRASNVAPVVMVGAEAIDSLLDRTFEGTITTRVVPPPASGPLFTDTVVPIRLEPTGKHTAIDLPSGGEVLPDADALLIELEISNLATAVELSDGSCAPSLNSLANANPFVGATTSTMTAQRNPSMHAVGGHHIVIGTYPEGTPDIGSTAGEGPSSMGEPLDASHPLVSPWTWLAETIDIVAPFTDVYNLHGNAATYNLQITLAPVSGGGAACDP